jgi:hypothetical protein
MRILERDGERAEDGRAYSWHAAAHVRRAYWLGEQHGVVAGWEPTGFGVP